MNVSLTPELERWIEERVQSGNYRSSSEVVREALRTMREVEDLKQLRREQLKASIARGLHDLDQGDSTVLTPDWFDELKRELYARPSDADGC